MKKIVVTGGFDNLRSGRIRFLEEASKLGRLHVLLWSDEAIELLTGAPAKFPQEERLYVLGAIRYVYHAVATSGQSGPDALPGVDDVRPDVWVVSEEADNAAKRAYSEAHGLEYHVLRQEGLQGFPVAVPVPEPTVTAERAPRKRVIVTGCYDWFHSGHVRFFEEVSRLGDLYVVVGHDDNIKLLKGAGHPLFGQDERRYVVQAVRYVEQALISSGHGWLDAEPEIASIQPDIYAVNEDGDVPEKRQFCQRHGIEYVVLKRTPKEGLPKRESTALRGF